MPPVDAAALLAAVDALPLPEREALFARTVRAVRAALPAGAAAPASPTGAAGADATIDVTIDALVGELAARGRYGRRLAAFAAVLAARADLLAPRLTDPDRVVRGRAIDALRTVPELASAVPDAYRRAPHAVRRQLREAVARGRDAQLAARLLPVARAHGGESEAAALLPACPPEVVAAELPGLAPTWDAWWALGARHPDAVLDHVERELAARPDDAAPDRWGASEVPLAPVLALRPARVLDLLERHPGRGAPWWALSGFGHLLAVDAERATAWLAATPRPRVGREEQPSRTALDRLARADPPSLPALGRRWLPEPRLFAPLLRAVPPARRAAFLDAAADGQPLDAARLTEPVLRLLPRERRWQEARRLHAEQAAKGLTGPHLLWLTALSEPERARAELLERTRLPHPGDRAEAWRRLVLAAAADRRPEAVAVLLADLSRLHNEQDPVRQSALTALAAFPAHRFTAAHAEALTTLTATTLDARDCSPTTRTALTTLAAAVLATQPTDTRPADAPPTGAQPADVRTAGARPTNAPPTEAQPTDVCTANTRPRAQPAEVQPADARPAAPQPANTQPAEVQPTNTHPADARPALVAFALATVGRLADRDGELPLSVLAAHLPRGRERQLLDALRPRLDADRRQGRTGLLFALVRALGERAGQLPELDGRLAEATRDPRERTAAEALELWLRPRAGRTAKVLAALDHDPSAVFCAPVLRHAALARTDLLDLALAERPPTGRFLRPGEPRPLPPAHDPARWTPRQVERAAELCAQAAADPGLTAEQRAAAIARAARLLEPGAAVVRRHLDDPEPLLADTALAALARTSDPAAVLPELLAHAGGDRAKVAVYAAGRAARQVDPGQLAPLLGELAARTDGAKVTARKEAVRLAAALLPPVRAAEVLAAAFRAPGQHADVRAAAAAHCQDLLDAEPLWALLAEAAAAPEPQLRRAVAAQPPRLLPERHRARYARLVAAVASRACTDPEADPEATRAALKALPEWARYAPDVAEVLPAAVTDLDDRATWRTASLALRALAVSDLPHPTGGAAPGSLLHRTLAALLAAEPRTAEPRTAAPSTARDQPVRQRIESLTAVPTVRRHREVRLALAEQLRPYEELLDLRAVLLARVAEPAGAGRAGSDFGADVARLAGALADRPVLAARLAAHLAGAVAGSSPLPTAADTAVPDALLSLLPGRGPALGLFAAALAEQLGTRCAWTGRWLPLLAALRAHPDAEVRSAAGAVTVAPE
ncbi:hypothetical protein [Kitasatospora phosalacinea]|uniref:Uncharacterized protein n=1 Tax=Kitasatospora phosalacinea TaxID=2065 RepID=A0ABW6GEY6_9ACTN